MSPRDVARLTTRDLRERYHRTYYDNEANEWLTRAVIHYKHGHWQESMAASAIAVAEARIWADNAS